MDIEGEYCAADEPELEHEESSDNDDTEDTKCQKCIRHARSSVIKIIVRYKKVLRYLFWLALAVLYYLYFGYAMHKTFNASNEDSMRLLIVTVAVSLCVVLYLMRKCFSASRRCKALTTFNTSCRAKRILWKTFLWTAMIGTFIFVIAYVIVNVALERPESLTSAVGIAVFVIIPLIGSKNPARVHWRPVFWGLALQFYLLVLLRWRYGYQALVWLEERINEFLNHAEAGSVYVFGESYGDHYFAFHVFVLILYCSTMISALYYLGIMQFIIKFIATFLAFCLGTSMVESLAAASNIFLGSSETAMVIRPFVKNLTRAEMHAVCTLGFGTIASSMIGAYIAFGIPANHLLTASIMSAPAGLAMSKLFYPDTKRPREHDGDPYSIPKGYCS